MSEEKNTKKWIFISVSVFIVISLFISTNYFKKEKTKIEFVIAEKSQLIQKVNVTGSIKSAEEVRLGFEISGRVSRVNIDVGDKVMAGQTVIQLDSDDLKAELLHTQANLAEEEAKLAKLKAGTRIEEINIQKIKIDNAKISLVDVKKEVVNKLRDSYLKSDDSIRSKADKLFSNPRSANPELNVVVSNNQLETDVESGRILLEQILILWEKDLEGLTFESDLASFVYKTDNNLYKIRDFMDNIAFVVNSITASASISQITIDGYKADVWTARNNINTAISNLTIVQKKFRSAQSALTLSENELILKEAGATNEDILAQEARVLSVKARVKNAEVKLAKTFIRSPISGLVTTFDAEVGEIVSANTVLVVVMSDDDFEIEANIAESDIAKISIGDSSEVTLDAYGYDVIFKAVVSNIDPAETVIEGVPTYKTTFKLLSGSKNIKSGMTANIDILTDKKVGVIVVPARVVNTANKIKTVRVLRENGVIDEREVETGLRGSDGGVEILSGVEEGEKVVIFMP